MKTLLRTTTLVFGATLAVTVFAQNRTFTSQYTFGDSLSDSGNLYALTQRTQPPAPYFQGRFSNGPVFTEMLGNSIVPAAPLSSAGTNRNFAFGGATAAGGGAIPGFGQQIAAYRLQGAPAQRTDLFTVLFGANDLLGVLTAPTTPANPGALDAAGVSAAQSVATGVQGLVGLGAKNLVVAGLPNLGTTPRSLALGGPSGPAAAFGLRATNAFNTELRSRLQAIAASAPDVNLIYVDLQGVLDRIVADYRALGFSNASSFFLAPSAQGGGVGDPNSYVFWDDIHPTSRTHSLLAAVITEQLNPEIPLGFAATIGSSGLALQNLEASAIDARASQIAVSNRGVGRADAYATFNYGDGNRARDGWRPKFDFDAYALTTGVDLRVNDGFFAGGALNVGRLKTDLTAGRGSYTMEDAGGRVYGVWHGGPVSLIADADYGVLSVKTIRRTTSFGGLQSNGKTGGDHWGVGLKAAWDVEMAASNLRPWIGLRTQRVRLDAYTEKDIPALAMDFDEQDAKSISGAIGVDCATNWKLGGRAGRFDLRAAWHGEIGSSNRTVSGKLANNFTRTSTLEVEDGDGSGVELGGAVTLFFAKNWSASLGYAADIRADERVANRGTFSIQTGF